MEIFAERLKELRLERGLSIDALSKCTNISSSTICRWENCQTEIKCENIVILAKFFKVSSDYLLGLED